MISTRANSLIFSNTGKELRNLQTETPTKGPTYKANLKDRANINGKQGLFMKANSKTGCGTVLGSIFQNQRITNIMDSFLTIKNRVVECFISLLPSQST